MGTDEFQISAGAKYLHAETTRAIIGAAQGVHSALGHGFLESIHATALDRDLKELGHEVSREAPIDVFYEGQRIGLFFADLLVNGW